MDSKKLIRLNLAEKLKKKAYRLAFFRARAQDDTAANIRALREKRELSQIKLAELSGMKQSAISRIEQAEYSSWTYKTLQRVAEALDARLVVIFEPAEDVIARYENMENFQSLTASVKTAGIQKIVEHSTGNREMFGGDFSTDTAGLFVAHVMTNNGMAEEIRYGR